MEREPGDGPADDDAAGRGPDDMSLDELRAEIEQIDREIVDLIARRTYVAETIAAVKDERDMATTDESQEEAVMERAGQNAEAFDVDPNLVKAVFRLLIELNKAEQRRVGSRNREFRGVYLATMGGTSSGSGSIVSGLVSDSFPGLPGGHARHPVDAKRESGFWRDSSDERQSLHTVCFPTLASLGTHRRRPRLSPGHLLS